MARSCQDFGLTPEVIAKFVVAVAAGITNLSDGTKIRLKRQEMGLTQNGKPRALNSHYYKYPDLRGIPLQERKKIISKRWRAAQKLKAQQP